MSIGQVVKWVAIILILAGALNWGLVGAFHFNVVTAIFGELSVWSRVVYVLIGVAGLYKILLIAMKK